jgi:hypothetical protein
MLGLATGPHVVVMTLAGPADRVTWAQVGEIAAAQVATLVPAS